MSEVYDADYYLRGTTSGKSLYCDYRWLPRLTIPMVKRIIEHCGIEKNHRVLDFGCARGYVVRAFRELGFNAFGADVSEWALANADEAAYPFVDTVQAMLKNSDDKYDWIVAKDVLEHVVDVQNVINDIMASAQVGVFAVVPLSLFDGHPYVVASYEQDVTHVHRLCLGTWAGMFMRPGWSVDGRYALSGVKGNYASWEKGNGFLTCRRLES